MFSLLLINNTFINSCLGLIESDREADIATRGCFLDEKNKVG